MIDSRLRLLAGTAVALTGAVWATASLADTSLGWYAAVDGGNGLSSSQKLKVSDVTLTSAPTTATAPLTAGDYQLGTDYASRGFVRLGYRFTPHLRTELEFGARPGKLNSGLGGPSDLDLGTANKSSAMANFIVDFLPSATIHPFIGIGAGVVQAKTDYHEPVSTTGHSLVYSIASDRTVPAGQFLAGASLDITQRLHFDMTYRYLRTGSTSYDVAVSDMHGGATDTYAAKGQGAIEDQSVTVGLRWTFGAPRQTVAAPSVAEAAPAAHRHWLPAWPWSKASDKPVASVSSSVPMASAGPAALPSAGTAAGVAAPLASTAYAGQATGNSPAVSGQGMASQEDSQDSTSDDATATAPSYNGGPSSPSANGAPLATTTQAAGANGGSAGQVPESRQYTTYFPLGGWHLDATGKATVASAAQYALSAPAAQVQIDGYADTSGSLAYNFALSRRRAGLVAHELEDNGVAAAAVSVAWHGERHLAVPTGDGVANAQNRRVTISVQFNGANSGRHGHGHWRHHHRRHH